MQFHAIYRKTPKEVKNNKVSSFAYIYYPLGCNGLWLWYTTGNRLSEHQIARKCR